MSVLIFRLNGVGDDEAQEVRELFEQHDIAYYETDAGRWGISVAALWLIDKQQLDHSKQLLADYQLQRQLRRQNASDQDEDRPLSVKQRISQAPLQFLLIVIAIIAVFALSTLPFISMY